MLVSLLFYVFAAVLIVAALGLILARNPVHSALCLVLCFFTSAAIWILIEAEFLALVLILVYVGAVMVLFLFVVMMLDINLESLKSGLTRYSWAGWVTAVVLVVELVCVFVGRRLGLDGLRGGIPLPASYNNTRELGLLLYTRYVYPFELASVLLLVAIMAAIALTLRKRPGHKVQDISRQVATRAADRLRLVKMDVEKRS